MTKRLLGLISDVEALYRSSERKWGKWAFDNHVKIVASYAEKIASSENGNGEFVVAAAYLHDLGDIWFEREDPAHEPKTMEKSQELLAKNGFTQSEIQIIIEQIIKPHSCRELKPTTLEGKVMATADALAHLGSDFYLQLCWLHIHSKSYADFKAWLKQKIERDCNDKIFFESWRSKAKPIYQAWKALLE